MVHLEEVVAGCTVVGHHLSHLVEHIAFWIAELNQLLYFFRICKTKKSVTAYSVFRVLTYWFLLVIYLVFVFADGQEGAWFGGGYEIVVPGIVRNYALTSMIAHRLLQCLLDLDALRLIKFVLLLKGVVCDDLVIDSVIKLAIVIEFILPIDFATLL